MKDTRITRRITTNAVQPTFNRATALGMGALGLLLAGGLGAGILRSSRPALPGVIVLGAVDVSGSHTAKERKQAMGVIEAAVETALPFRTPLRLWQFDGAAREMYAGRPESGQDLWSAEDEICRYASSTKGTHVERAIAQMLPPARQAGAAGQSVGVILVWDGDDADPRATRQAAAALASLPNVRAVWLVGAKTEEGLRSAAERQFSALGARLVISGPLDERDGLEAFQSKVRGK